MFIYLLSLLQEYLVIINAYNGTLIPFIPEIIEYSIVEVVIFIWSLVYLKKIKLLEVLINLLCLFSQFQWYFHDPFEEWPKWWPAEKSIGDIRHRTEYYDTHVMIFSIRFLLFMKFIEKLKLNSNS